MRKNERYLYLWLAFMATLAPLLAPALIEGSERIPGLWIPGAVWFHYLIFKFELGDD